MGVATILYLTATTTMVQIEARPEMRGRVLSLQTVLFGGTTPIGGPLLGWLADATGGRTPIILARLVCLMAAIFGFLANRHYLSSTS